jgi:hypothetical protein
MKYSRMTFLLFLIAVIGCKRLPIQTSWKPVNPQPVIVNKILVAVILPEKDSALRKSLEEQLSADIDALGYYAVSSWHEFGRHGLMLPEQEQTYLRLCERGIDAVMTVALVDEGKQHPAAVNQYSNLAYYNRIWSYRHLHLQDTMPAANNNNVYLEALLFDLNRLQPVYFSKTRPFLSGTAKSSLKEYAKNIFKHMVKTRTLVRTPKSKAA